jgi:hypothetical protein
MAVVLTPRLTGARPIKPTTPRCPAAWQHNARQEFPLNDAEILFKEPEPPFANLDKVPEECARDGLVVEI